MSIFDSLEESGITQEDLEKAASARLFAEAAAAEGIDLNELSEDQAEELYDFWANGGEEKTAADEDADAFFAAAASQGIDLDELTEGQVGELYEFWANGGEEKTASAEEMLADAAVKEASAKLAEAEYIGRYMARIYAGELDKIAEEDKDKDRGPTKHPVLKSTGVGAGIGGLVGGTSGALSGAAFRRMVNAGGGQLGHGATGLGALLGAGMGASTGGGYGLAHGLGRRMGRKDNEKESSIDDLIEERALEMIIEAEAEKLADFKTRARNTLGDAATRVGDAFKATRLRGAAGKDFEDFVEASRRNHAHNNVLEEFKAPSRAKEIAKGLAETGGAYGGLALAGYGGVKGAKKMFGKKDAEKQSSIDDIIELRALELLKEAEDAKPSMMDRIKGLPGKAHGHVGSLGERLGGEAGKGHARGYGAAAAGTLAAGGLAYGGKKLLDRRKAHRESEKQSSIDDIIEARAVEMLEEAQLAQDLDEAALELLAANGY